MRSGIFVVACLALLTCARPARRSTLTPDDSLSTLLVENRDVHQVTLYVLSPGGVPQQRLGTVEAAKARCFALPVIESAIAIRVDSELYGIETSDFLPTAGSAWRLLIDSGYRLPHGPPVEPERERCRP